MLSYSRSHLADHVLLSTLDAVVKQDRVTTAEMLALIAEVDRRRLFRGEGFPSMYRYCIGKLAMTEDMACKRISAARAARMFPAVLPSIADGRLSLTVVAMLKKHITLENGEELLSAAAGMTKSQAELLIAERFPQADVPTTLVAALPPARPAAGDQPAQNDLLALPTSPAVTPQVAGSMPGAGNMQGAGGMPVVGQMQELPVPERVDPENSVPIAVPQVPLAPQRRVAPLSLGRFELRLTISQQLHDKLLRAQELLGHALPSGDIPQLLERAIDELIAKQERLRFAATERPRKTRGTSRNPRHVAAEVKREVHRRDQGRCTYVSEDGHRCESRELLQYDHEIPVARGGAATVENLRLRCRAHNQLEAERMFGAGFMEEKRNGSRDGRTYN